MTPTAVPVFPTPRSWNGYARGEIGGWIIYSVASIALVALAVAALASGRPFAFLCVMIAAVGYALDNAVILRAVQLRRSSRISSTSVSRKPGLSFSPDVWARWLEVCSTLALGVGMLLFGIGEWNGWVRLPIVGEGSKFLYPLVAFIIGIICIWSASRNAIRANRELRVTPGGIESPGFRDPIPWSDVTQILPSPIRGDRRIGAWISTNNDHPRSDDVRLDQHAAGAPAAFWLIDFYWRHPELRDELGDGRAVDRLRTGTVVEGRERYV